VRFQAHEIEDRLFAANLMNFQEAIDYLQSFPDMERATFGARGPTMGLPSMMSLLERMGNPHIGRNTVHIAGSKGKGSTTAMITRILEEAGLKTSTFTSPHFHDYRERIAIGGIPVSQELFAKGIEQLKPIFEAEKQSGNGSLATFGLLTALFFHLTANAQPKVDWQIVEVGLGGRYDVTNVFSSKELAIITPISLEHVEVLGSTQTEIAANKAGIIVPKCTAIMAAQKDSGAKTAIGRRCREVQANFIDVSKAYKTRITNSDLDGQSFLMESPKGSYEFFTPMLGAHQVTNASTAAAAAFALAEQGHAISAEHIANGLRKTEVPGRFEILQGEPGKENGPVIVADSAHNHESAQALAQTLKGTLGVESCIFVLGLSADKNVSAVWKELSPLCRMCVTTKSKNPRSFDPGEIADVVSTLQSNEAKIVLSNSVTDGIEEAKKLAKNGEVICITGSIYVVGEAREYLLKDKARESLQLQR